LRTLLVIEDDQGAADLIAIDRITRLRVKSENLPQNQVGPNPASAKRRN
jgi:hypothetical protein